MARLEPKEPATLCLQAAVCEAKLEMGRAKEAYTKALQLDPHRWETSLAFAHFQTRANPHNPLGASEKLFQQAIATCDRRSPHPMTAYGGMLQRLLQRGSALNQAQNQGDTQQLVTYAFSLYAEALAVDPLDADALTNSAALTAFCANEGGAALALLKKAVEANPGHVGALCNYGQLLMSKAMAFASFQAHGEGGQQANADDAVNAKNAGRNGVLARWEIVDVSAGGASGTDDGENKRSSALQGEETEEMAPNVWMREGLSVLERALELEPRNVATICALSQGLQALPAFGEEAQPERVHELLLLARERAPPWDPLLRATACCNLAASLSASACSKERTKALSLLNEALRVYPSHLPSLRSLVDVHSAQGDYGKAQQVLHKAIALNPAWGRLDQALLDARSVAPCSDAPDAKGLHCASSPSRKRPASALS